MIDYLLTILACSVYCFGWWIVTNEGNILFPLKQWADRNLHKWIYKPLFGCVVCYGSIHGGSMYCFITGDYIMLIPAMISISGVNYMLASKYGD